MDTDAIDGAGSAGTNAGGKPARAPAEKVRDFLKTQALYVAVVLLVIVLGGMRTWKEFRAQEEEQPWVPIRSFCPDCLLGLAQS